MNKKGTRLKNKTTKNIEIKKTHDANIRKTYKILVLLGLLILVLGLSFVLIAVLLSGVPSPSTRRLILIPLGAFPIIVTVIAAMVIRQ